MRVVSRDFAERVLELVERIPPGQVLSYGLIAEILQDGGPRQVGRVMAMDGGGVPWWRVVRADGSLPPSHLKWAHEHYHEEGTPLRADGTAVDMKRGAVAIRRLSVSPVWWDGGHACRVRPGEAERRAARRSGARRRPARGRSPTKAGPLLVLAGPGTGKTTTLVELVVDRVERGDRGEIGGLAPDEILVLTFSRKAAAEIRGRIARRLDRTTATTPAMTFHSFCYGMLRAEQVPDDYASPMRLLSAPEQDAVISEVLAGADPKTWPVELRPASADAGHGDRAPATHGECAFAGFGCRRPRAARRRERPRRLGGGGQVLRRIHIRRRTCRTRSTTPT